MALQLRSKIPVGPGCIAPAGSACRRPRRSTTMAASARRLSTRPAEGLPAAARAGQPEARIRRPGRRLDEARRRRPAGRPRRALSAVPLRSRLSHEHPLPHRVPVLGEARAARRELAQRAPARAVRRRRARGRQFAAEAPGVRYDYSRQRLGAMTLRLLAHLAGERGFAEWREALLAGSTINIDREARRLAHGLARGRCRARRSQGNAGPHEAAGGKLRRERQFKRIVNLGTGGSDLGPRLVADALGRRRRSTCASPPTSIRATSSARSKAPIRRARSSSWCRRPSPRRKRWPTPSARQRWGAKNFYRRHRQRRGRQGVRRERDPADVGLGRRALLGLVGGGLCRRVRHRLRRRSRSSCAGAQRHRRALRARRRSRRTSRR